MWITRIKLTVLALAIFLVLCHNPAYASSPAPDSHETTTHGTDWPMFGHDAMHTGTIHNEIDAVTRGITLLNSYETGGVVRSSPAVADIDGDGSPNILVGSFDRRLYNLGDTGGHGDEGSQDEGGHGDQTHEVASLLIWMHETQDWVESSPAVADLDGDGLLEIVVGSHDGNVICLDSSGKLKWSYETGDAVVSSPTAYDLDGDGHLEVVVGSSNGMVYAIDYQGGPIWNFTAMGSVVSSPAVVDLDGDDEPEIIIGSSDGMIYCLDTSGGVKWTYATNGPVRSSPAVGDLNGDGKLEVVIGSNDDSIYCLDASGNMKWFYSTNGPVLSSPAIGDLDGDHEVEIVVGSSDSTIYCLDSEGDLKWSYPTNAPVDSSPAIGDLDQTEGLEVVIGSSDGNVYCISSSGTILWKYTTKGAISSSPALADVNHDGIPEVIVGSDDNTVYILEINMDSDHDGLFNTEEHEIGTDAHSPDSDHDGIMDGEDTYPLDFDNDGVPDFEDVFRSINNRTVYAMGGFFILILVGVLYLSLEFMRAAKLDMYAKTKATEFKKSAIAGFIDFSSDFVKLVQALPAQSKKTKVLLMVGAIIALQGFMVFSYLNYMVIQWSINFCFIGCHVGSPLMAEPYYAWNESAHGNNVAACHDCHHARPLDNAMLFYKTLFVWPTEIKNPVHMTDHKCTQCHGELEEVKTKYMSPLVPPTLKRIEEGDLPLELSSSDTGHGVHVSREEIECVACHATAGVHRFKPKGNVCDKCHYDPRLGPPEEYKVSAHGGGH